MQNNKYNTDDLTSAYNYAKTHAANYIQNCIDTAQNSGKTICELQYSNVQNHILAHAGSDQRRNQLLQNNPWLIITAVDDYLNNPVMPKAVNKPLYSTKSASDLDIYPESDLKDILYSFETDSHDRLDNKNMQKAEQLVQNYTAKHTEFDDILAVMQVLTYYSEYASHQNDEYIANILAFLSPHDLNKTIYLYLF